MFGISLRNTPIQRKLTLVILLTTSFALLLMGTALITYELVTFRRSMAVNLGVLAQIIGSNSTAALAFDDSRSGHEILSALAAEKQISAAAIYSNDGTLFASFPERSPRSDFPTVPGPDGYSFARSHLTLFHPIVQQDKRLGTIYVRADLDEMYSRLIVYGVLLLLVAATAFMGAQMLSRTLQRQISAPILALAKVATAVSERQDYSVRADKHGDDEVGQLTAAFNEMLTRIGETNTALAASEERLRLALKGSQTGTWDWNLVTNHVTWDDYMYPLYGRTKEEFDGRPETARSFIHPEDRAAAAQARAKALNEGCDLDVVFRIVTRAGEIRYMASRGRAFYDEQGRAVRMSGVTLDITRSKQTEADLSRAKEAAEAANQAKDNFLAILSHELRTPLTPVLAAVASLKDDGDVPAHIASELEMIRRNIEVEARLIDDLLDVTGMVRGKMELNRKIVDVPSLLDHALKNYCMGIAQKKNLRVTTEVTAAQTHVFADSSRLTQVFWNLLQNSCKFTPAGGAIYIRVFNEKPAQGASGNGSAATAEAPSDGLVVEIEDTGIGINPESMPRIFNAFEQGERSRTRTYGGLGLGLAISRAIIELHGGIISARSAGEGRGATMSIRLRTAPAVVADAQAQPHQPTATARAAGSRALSILLVEDHPDTAEQLTRLLTRAGHRVTAAGSIKEARQLAGAEAASEMKRCPFDLLISDLGLPDGNGQDLMRDLGVCHDIPGIALSGFGMEEDIAASLAAGFTRHLTKPVDWQELKAEIDMIAQQIPSPTEATSAV
jgi:PAS domain S-box-containing protein